jgi:hypothetical protein
VGAGVYSRARLSRAAVVEPAVSTTTT